MDKEKAKFILSSFRPCGADANDPSFQDALKLAIEDQELSEWLVKERSFDREFGECVQSISIPEDLKSQLDNLLYAKSEENSENDLEMIGALATINPPQGLREEILTAMQVPPVVENAQPNSKKENKVLRFWFPMAAAAMIAVATFLGVFIPKESSGQSFSLAEASLEVLRKVEKGNIALDMKESDFLRTASWADAQNIPTPEDIPQSLRHMETVGCKKLDVRGMPASLTCFHTKGNKVLHLIVIEPKNTASFTIDIPMMEQVKGQCSKCPKTGCSFARWHDGDKIYFLISKQVALEEFEEVF